jgi:CheY-like chemotaxis protein
VKAMKVMILDDAPFILSLLAHIFHHRGYEVATYSNPTACPIYNESCQCQREQPCANIVISDYDMPLVNGLEFFEALRGKGCKCPHMALVSGSLPDRDIMDRVAKLGVRFFTKPLHRNQIIDWLDQIEASLPRDETNQGSTACGKDALP